LTIIQPTLLVENSLVAGKQKGKTPTLPKAQIPFSLWKRIPVTHPFNTLQYARSIPKQREPI